MSIDFFQLKINLVFSKESKDNICHISINGEDESGKVFSRTISKIGGVDVLVNELETKLDLPTKISRIIADYIQFARK